VGRVAELGSLDAKRVKLSVTELPFNKFVGIQIADEAAHLLRLPSGKQYLNHLGTVHASAQLVLAEASSGEFLLRHFGSAEGIIPVVRRMGAKFRKPASGSITSSVTVAHETLAQLDRELSARGRTLISIPVEIHDESGAHTLSATFEWFIQHGKSI
jgi:acyl-coenzyme A thioesterase PaaI-like protein